MLPGRLILLLVLVLVQTLGSHQLQAAPALDLAVFKGKLAQVSLQDSLEYFVDESGQLTIDEVLQDADSRWIQGKKPIVGFTSATLWVRFQVFHGGSAPAEILLEDKWASILRLELFHFHEGNLIRRKLEGQALPFEDKDLDHRLSLFKLSLPQGTSTFYVQYRTDNILGSRLFLWDHESFHKARDRERLYIGVLLGFFIILPLYNAFFYFTLKEKVYLYYVLYGLVMAVFNTCMFGFAGQITGSRLFVSSESIVFTGALAIFFVYRFVIEYLGLRNNLQRMMPISLGLSYLSFVPMILVFFAPTVASAIIVMLNITLLGWLLTCSISLVRAGYKPAIIFLIAWVAFIVGDAITVSYYVGLTPYSFLGNWGMMIGGAVESVLISIGVGIRFEEIRKSLRDSENEARHREKDALASTIHAFKQLEKVVYPHQIRQIRNGLALEDTMPLTPAHACVISFDIVGSSKIRHIKAKEFFRQLFASCYKVMAEGYDGVSLQANAYRIKEMGDGFLCSIGYPFRSKTDNPANDALDIAKKFVQTLAQESQILNPEVPLCCCIGIALDTLTGFYPESGTKEYDLFGPAIVLATRYEAMRKALFSSDMDRSVIIIQEVVYASLDPIHRQGFQKVDLKDRGMVVRDDPAATRLYYQFMEHPRAEARSEPVAQAG